MKYEMRYLFSLFAIFLSINSYGSFPQAQSSGEDDERPGLSIKSKATFYDGALQIKQLSPSAQMFENTSQTTMNALGDLNFEDTAALAKILDAVLQRTDSHPVLVTIRYYDEYGEESEEILPLRSVSKKGNSFIYHLKRPVRLPNTIHTTQISFSGNGSGLSEHDNGQVGALPPPICCSCHDWCVLTFIIFGFCYQGCIAFHSGANCCSTCHLPFVYGAGCPG